METTTTIKSGYEILNELCSFKADFNAFNPRINPITNRVQYIITQCERLNLPFEIDTFNAKGTTLPITETTEKLVNIYIKLEGENKNHTTVFLAHHDIANPQSENCQDNTASVANLLHLAQLLKNKETLPNNVLIAFTDAEEIVSITRSGAKRLADLINAENFGTTNCINLELTANGKNIWASTFKNKNGVIQKLKQITTINEVETPFNDSYTLCSNNIDSVCIGTLTDSELSMVKERKYCQTWALCHSPKDTFDLSANKEDMNTFVELLVEMI